MVDQNKMPIPFNFICPITREIMVEPVLLIEDGHSYELSAIERWLEEHNSSPITNQQLEDRRFVFNFNLKHAIEEYRAQQQFILSSNQFFHSNIRYSRIPSKWNNYHKLTIRLSLLGSSNTGKTTLVHFLQFGPPSQPSKLNPAATLASDLSFFYLDKLYDDKYVVSVQLYDIPGMERYESCCDSHFRTCHGAVLLTDSTDIDTLERLELYWYKQLRMKGREHVETVLVCNKVDLFEKKCDEDYRKIFLERAEYFASAHKMPIYYTSALNGDNVQSMLKLLIMRILQNEHLLQQIKDDSMKDQAPIVVTRPQQISSTETSYAPQCTENNQNRPSFYQRCCS